jgi:hypothetical protein
MFCGTDAPSPEVLGAVNSFSLPFWKSSLTNAMMSGAPKS